MDIQLKIGFLCWTGDKYIQVRHKIAGSVHMIKMSTDSTKEDLLQEAKGRFFPNGK